MSNDEVPGAGIEQTRFMGYSPRIGSGEDPAPTDHWGTIWARRAIRPTNDGGTSAGDWHWHCAIRGVKGLYNGEFHELQFFGSCEAIEAVPEEVTRAWYAMPVDQLPRETDNDQLKRPMTLVWVIDKVSFEQVVLDVAAVTDARP